MKNKLMKNTISSFVFQAVSIISGFIIPRLILSEYGSDVNGLVSSITQFLSVIAFMELGVGSVLKSSLYKPLLHNDNDQISKLYVSANKFFKTIASALIIYTVALIFAYPYFSESAFSKLYIDALIVILFIKTFAQYYFGIVNRLLLQADQRGYIYFRIQSFAVVLDTIACYVLVSLKGSIHLVKLTTSLIYIIPFFFMYFYVDKHYKIDKKITYSEEPIQQKWNGIAQHMAAVVLDGTDTIVLTLFSTLSNVSIYSVYHLVVKGVKQMFMVMTNGIQSLLGELYAKDDEKQLKDVFAWTDWIIHTSTSYVFGVCVVLIIPFVSVYTRGIKDTNYIVPLFAILITIANAGHCLRLPYSMMILAAGHYKQTQSNYIIAALLNIAVSVFTVKLYGLVGVAIGTLIAMGYQTIWMAKYVSNNIMNWEMWRFYKQLSVDIIIFIVIYFTTSWIQLSIFTYGAWVVLAIKVSILSILEVIALNYIFYKDKIKECLIKLKNIIKR